MDVSADFILDGRRQEVALNGGNASWWLSWYEINAYYTAIWVCAIDGDLVWSDMTSFLESKCRPVTKTLVQIPIDVQFISSRR